MTDLFDLTGRRAIVTGGSAGIGLGMARGLAGKGAAVAIVGRDGAKAEAAARTLRDSGGQAIALSADVASEADCARIVAEAAEALGGVDILVNNAGTNVRKPPEDYTLDEWKSLIDTNLTSAFVLSQAVFPYMKEGGGGRIINIGSMTSLFGAPFAAPYSATKGGILQLTKALAAAWAKHGICVNAVLPGWIDTTLTEQLRKDVPHINDAVLARTPAARWGRPDDFEGIAVFLASPASAFVTGAAIPVDGGYSANA
ncbi:2-deoxy-D-gluconate 3-dehydrogenase [Acuticoccus sediminis]|uniref:2-deoxy-D-gluconate 3-dehydrogenase n=1 Tax=Acuticoccus sediminis TaxID=2184697 RepID=A0A8B2NNP5_9HYPH|nr:glucose 1-dehydrogenase [Acuticoccus sediminis]RAI01516.1 2-deoxy-D-gluconate 3-dehydrogenase [Acuticoccus sediminis]